MTQRYSEQFLLQLDGFDLDTLENDTSCIYGLTRELTLNYMNPAWFKFANDNDGTSVIDARFGVGTPITAAFCEPLRSHYSAIYHGLLRTGQVWQHDFECSSERLYRMYHQTVYPLRNLSGLLVVNSLRIEQAHATRGALADAYLEPSGLMTACVHCKRVHRKLGAQTWDSVPSWKERMPANLSHSLCPICFDYFYKHMPVTHA